METKAYYFARSASITGGRFLFCRTQSRSRRITSEELAPDMERDIHVAHVIARPGIDHAAIGNRELNHVSGFRV
jgi:hypothetical protein